jgi:thiol:disulfide interchange protein DsbC
VTELVVLKGFLKYWFGSTTIIFWRNYLNILKKRIAGRPLWAIVLAGLILPAMQVNAGSVVVDKAAEAAIRASFKATRPDIVISKVVASEELPGLYLVTMQNGPVVYASANGKYFIVGDMFEISAAGIESVAEKKLAPQRQEWLSEVKREDMIIFSPKGKAKGAIYVFTDVDCGFCQKLHQEVPQLNAAGIEVRYLAYPRAGLGTPTYDKMASAWCADDRNAAMDALKSGGFVTPKKCDNPIAAQYQLGAAMGVTGTPAIVLENGSLIPGYKPAAQLIPMVLR